MDDLEPAIESLIRVAQDIRDYYEMAALGLSDHIPSAWSGSNCFFQQTECGKLVLAARAAMRDTGEKGAIWLMRFSNTYVDLGDQFYQRIRPVPVRDPKLLLWNKELAAKLQIADSLTENSLVENRKALAELFSGNRMLPGSEPIALAYAGHQFGQFSPQLGDGRAHLLGEVFDSEAKRNEIQLKGSGPTAFSRGGDGRCAIGPAIREFVMSEAMHALGVPTTRCLAVVSTGEQVYRESVLPGAVVTRVAASHLRVGTFQYFSARHDLDSLKTLSDYAIKCLFPELKKELKNEQGHQTLLLLEKVIKRQVQLVCEWMRVGFIHGVMNTDNTAISGETIDFGPCAMMGVYNPNAVHSSIDQMGRYAFGNQPSMIHWNMARFAESLLPLVEEGDSETMDRIDSLVADIPYQLSQEFTQMMARKFGIAKTGPDDDELLKSLLQQFVSKNLDYTNTFDLLTNSLSSTMVNSRIVSLKLEEELGQNYIHWGNRVREQDMPVSEIQSAMRLHNPVVIPRNHHIEVIIKQCEESGEVIAAQEMLEVLRHPYDEGRLTSHYRDPPLDRDEHYQTFCGT